MNNKVIANREKIERDKRWTDTPIPQHLSNLSDPDINIRKSSYIALKKELSVSDILGLLAADSNLERLYVSLMLRDLALRGKLQPADKTNISNQLRTALTSETSWITAQSMILALRELGAGLPDRIPVIDAWAPNQSDKITVLLKNFIKEIERRGYGNQLVSIISERNSYTRNMWMEGSDIDYLQIVHNGIPAPVIAELKTLLEKWFLESGCNPTNVHRNTFIPVSSLDMEYGIHFEIYRKGAGTNFMLSDYQQGIPNYGDPVPWENKRDSRLSLFEAWNKNEFTTEEKMLIQRFQGAHVLRSTYAIDSIDDIPMTQREFEVKQNIKLDNLWEKNPLNSTSHEIRLQWVYNITPLMRWHLVEP